MEHLPKAVPKRRWLSRERMRPYRNHQSVGMSVSEVRNTRPALVRDAPCRSEWLAFYGGGERPIIYSPLTTPCKILSSWLPIIFVERGQNRETNMLIAVFHQNLDETTFRHTFKKNFLELAFYRNWWRVYRKLDSDGKFFARFFVVKCRPPFK